MYNVHGYIRRLFNVNKKEHLIDRASYHVAKHNEYRSARRSLAIYRNLNLDCTLVITEVLLSDWLYIFIHIKILSFYIANHTSIDKD
ncbi:hypothetical protein V1478_009998 [Vespula squamosa]|uniref:Uncharacterized protein n=1 Tax=Vespula squamosa TaxID=30214 RepID=A0ABD2AKU5_VESSQ